MSSFDTRKVIPIIHPTANFRYESANNTHKMFVGRHEKAERKEREKLIIGCRPVSIPPLRGRSELQILAAEEIRSEALKHFKPALQDFAPEQQMRTFLTIFLLRNLQAHSWLERASITDWAYYWRVMFETYLKTRVLKYERE